MSDATRRPVDAAAEGTEENSSGLALGVAELCASWAETELLVAQERSARGLDTPLGYTFLMEPPQTAAGYLHLAGRVGRSGSQGTALTFVTPKQVFKLKRHLDHLSLGLSPKGAFLFPSSSSSSSSETPAPEKKKKEEEEEASAPPPPLAPAAAAGYEALAVVALKAELRARGLKLAGLKSDLVQRLQDHDDTSSVA